MLKIQLSLDQLKEWINKFQTTRHTHNNNKVFKLSTRIWRHKSIFFNKMLQGTFTEMALKSSSCILDKTINLFREFSQLFGAQFVANVVKPPRMVDLFDVRQKTGESLKEYLNRFCKILVCFQNPRDEMVVDAFVKGLLANPFSNGSLRTCFNQHSDWRSYPTQEDKWAPRRGAVQGALSESPIDSGWDDNQQTTEKRYVPYVAQKERTRLILGHYDHTSLHHSTETPVRGCRCLRWTRIPQEDWPRFGLQLVYLVHVPPGTRAWHGKMSDLDLLAGGVSWDRPPQAICTNNGNEHDCKPETLLSWLVDLWGSKA